MLYPLALGMVKFVDVPTATTVVQSLNGVVLPGTSRPLEVRYADIKPGPGAIMQAAAPPKAHYQPYPPPGITLVACVCVSPRRSFLLLLLPHSSEPIF